ncbi:F-box associated domain containing protein [Tanacetum coccineum]|uniref:F-box associated domain containing protein n=1 Tax=Tanacetum coccineum TaxID=301880 RepID=A0ABQ5CVK0_9ASTR
MTHEDCEPEHWRFVRVVKTGILKWLEIKGEVHDTRLYQDFVMIFDLDLAPTFQNSNILQVGSVNGRWRRLGHVPYWLNEFHGPFLNGCVHWIFCGRDSPKELYAFNFDNETFSFFPSPPSEEIQGDIRRKSLAVINGCLSMCVTSALEFTIWVMKEYGIRKSWHKEVVFTQSVKRDVNWWMGEPVTRLFGLEDGTILMFVHEHFLVYCPWQKTIEKRAIFGRVFTGIAYRPSLFKLQTFESERVHVF